MLTSSKQMLLDAQAGSYAVGAFNVENMETVLAVLAAADALQAPVLLQTTPSSAAYAGLDMFAAMVGAAAAQVNVPVALHLDHGSSAALAARALRVGYTSLMIDGSHLPFEENIAVSYAVAAFAQCCGVPVEAELGIVGGKEDDLEREAETGTDPAQAAEFCARTGVDSLAVGIGTAHGFYPGTPVLDVERLSLIRAKVDVPLVLHGASGLSDAQIRDCVARGICKVNFATELRVAYSEGTRAALTDAAVFDPKIYGKEAMRHVTELVKSRITVCGCAGKAM
ncbi:MAG: ketose-bisphosphate aldolase [Oscillospiraceae bacterium]|jgi:tagatose 1,6-diphosphate aldolase GatY/KbaY|nr:ketose-bisphosphate aldolase [Oscillospiraceae bacterium]